MKRISRRRFVGVSAALGPAALCPSLAISAEPAMHPIGLGFSLYGMKSLEIGAALETCAEIGYDCVELPVLADWPWDSARLSADDRRRIRAALASSGLRLSALMENLAAVVDDARHRANLDRLKAAAELAHALSPDRAPVIETVLGGRPEQWDELRERMAERVADWAKVAEASRTVIAVKAHVGGAMHLPEHAVWLIEQIGSPWLRGVFDYSHFALRGVELAAAVRTLVPHSVFIHVKDGRGEPGKFEFLLPGEGGTDYPALLSQVAAAGYRGDVLVEVSGQIHSRPGYDPAAAARKCYPPLAAAFRKSGIPRR
jgi:inosose dehydratase